MPMPPTPARARLLRIVLCGAGVALALADPAVCAPHNLGSMSNLKRQPLQELIKVRRAPGKLYVSIPQAELFGERTGYAPYCSPHVRTINSSNKTVEELLTGISYRNPAGRLVGSTTSRFFQLKVADMETHFFNSVGTNSCDGLVGEVHVLRCVYEDGSDCSADVVPVAFGAVPLSAAAAQEN
jgi:hypothetical protein